MVKNKSNTFGVVSLILGILSLMFFLAPYIGVILSITAIVLYVKQKKIEKTGVATAGLVLGIIGTILNGIILLVLIVGLIFVSSINNYSNENIENTQSSIDEMIDSTDDNILEETTQTETAQTKVYKVGDSIQAGDFKWTITGFSTESEIGEYMFDTFMGEKADGEFIIVDVQVENTGNTAKYLMDSYLKLVDGQNREFSPNSVASIYLKPQGSALMFEQINPGIVKKGRIVFDVPVGLEVANVRISSNLISSSFYNVNLMV